MVFKEHSASDAVGRSCIIEPLVIVGIAELADVLRDILQQQSIPASHLDILMTAKAVHDIRKVSTSTFLRVLFGMLEQELLCSLVKRRWPLMQWPLAVTIAVLLRASDICRHVRVISWQRRADDILQIDSVQILQPNQAMQMHSATAMVDLGWGFARPILELEAREEV